MKWLTVQMFATDFLLRKETAGGGVLADFGVHVLDLLLIWLGDWASIEYRDDARGGIESDCEIRLRMRSGIEGTVEISRTRNLRNTCIFEGDRATLEVGIWDPDPTIALRIGNKEIPLAGHAGSSRLTFQDVCVRQIDDFAEARRVAGVASYVLVGQPGSMEHTFGTSCHGAGRRLSLSFVTRTLAQI